MTDEHTNTSRARVPLERASSLAPESFVRDYLAQNRPVIVTDAMAAWKALGGWSPEAFRERFGDEKVQIYDDLFFMINTRPLRDYLDRYILDPNRKPRAAGSRVPYVRWYSRQDERTDFPWSDDVLARLSGEWSAPYFMPSSDLLLPFAPPGRQFTPVRDLFPARGVFISAMHARTRLHTDPWASDAVLCQVYGEKRFILFRPDQVADLRRDGQLIDIPYDPATDCWAEASQRPYADDVLRPGEMILIPAGWGHAFHSTTASISITWNFVHAVNAERLEAYVKDGVPPGEARSFTFFAAPAPARVPA